MRDKNFFLSTAILTFVTVQGPCLHGGDWSDPEAAPRVIPIKEYSIDLGRPDRVSPPPAGTPAPGAKKTPSPGKGRTPPGNTPRSSQPGIFDDPSLGDVFARFHEHMRQFDRAFEEPFGDSFFKDHQDLFDRLHQKLAPGIPGFHGMDQLFEEFDSMRPGRGFGATPFQADPGGFKFQDQGDRLVAEYDLGGENPDNVRVDLKGNILTLKIEQNREENRSGPDGNSALRSESFFGRSQSLPLEVEPGFDKKVVGGKLVLTFKKKDPGTTLAPESPAPPISDHKPKRKKGLSI